jgi:hypothetical protein
MGLLLGAVGDNVSLRSSRINHGIATTVSSAYPSAPDRLRLDGKLDGREVTMALERVDLADFTPQNRGFHWVQEYPYFR